MTNSDRKPNLFVIGGMKCGSTSLHEYLDTHPEIAMSRQKEPGYFVEEMTLHRGEHWYLSLFDRDDRYRYIGESSTHYTKLPLYQGVPARLHDFNPRARLIYIMRNPLQRTLSHYWHNVRVRNIKTGGGESRPLLKAVKEDPRYLAFSDYATQLQPYIDRFGRSSVYTLTFESLVDNPQQELDRIYEWLGLSSYPLGKQLSRIHNKRPQELTAAAGTGILYTIQFSDTWNRISRHVPAGIKRLAKSLAHRPIDEHQMLDDVARLQAEIGELQGEQIHRLARLLGCDFPEWTGGERSSAADEAVMGRALHSPQ